ncbi:MAG: hypothetical protein HYY29_03740 [Chloroflexi bacterium]|nr:hypothetical protein [Chloroflexota bacterium]
MTQYDDVFRAVWRDIANLVTRTERLETQEPKVLGCRLIGTTGGAVLYDTPTAINFSQTISNTDSNWSTSQPTRLIANVAGYYNAGGGWAMSSTDTSTGRIGTILRLNGNVNLVADTALVSTGEYAFSHVVAGMVHMSSGDYVEVQAYHTMSTTKNIVAGSTADEYYANGWLVKVI